MFPAGFEKLWSTYTKASAIVTGLILPIGAGYVQLGGPLPASRDFVKSEVAGVAKKIDGLDASINELQRENIVSRKGRLQHELNTALELLEAGAANSAQTATLRRRAAEIRDELRELDKRDDALGRRVDRLRQAGGE
jgi:hypothetical protein